MSLPDLHLCLNQPAGHVGSLALLDPARYFRYHFRRLGARVSVAKNRLRHDAVNIVFGAHLGFDPVLSQHYACVFVNLEQLGEGGVSASSAYLQLLRRSAVIDIDPANLAHYTDHPDDVPLVPIVHAPYLAAEAATPARPLAERPIDLLFIGTLNERRRRLIDRIERTGLRVSVFDQPLYGPERDAYIRQARAVLNCHRFDASRLEMLRVAHCLGLGTPVVAERTPRTQAPAYYDDAVTWFEDADLEEVFGRHLGSDAWRAQAEVQLAHFAQLDPAEGFADALAFASGFGRTHARQRSREPWVPVRLNLAAGRHYRPNWLNIDPRPGAEADLVLDLGEPLVLPLQIDSALCGPVQLAAGQFEEIHAVETFERVDNLTRLMTQCLTLLREQGRLVVEVPLDRAPTAWQDPADRRAFNENAWLRCTDGFWQLSWFEHRFQIEQSTYLDLHSRTSRRDKAATMRVTLQKVRTTPHERTLARTMLTDCQLPDDLVPPDEQLLPPDTSQPLGALAETAAPDLDAQLAAVLQD